MPAQTMSQSSPVASLHNFLVSHSAHGIVHGLPSSRLEFFLPILVQFRTARAHKCPDEHLVLVRTQKAADKARMT